jgi:hypothetical protein
MAQKALKNVKKGLKKERKTHPNRPSVGRFSHISAIFREIRRKTVDFSEENTEFWTRKHPFFV